LVPVTLGPHLLLALLEGVVGALVLALTALGLSLVFGVMRIVNVAHGAFFMLGAVVTWYVSSATGSFLLALVAAPLAVGGIAIVADRLVLRRIGYEPESTIVATIGLLYILEQLVLMTYGPYARPVAAPIYFRIDFGWFGYSGYKLVVAAAAALLLVAAWLALSRTTLGLYLRATQQDREIAQAFAVPVGRVYSLAFGVGGGLAALAGALIVPVQQAHYLMGLDALLLSFVVVILGGLGSLTGTVVAALVVGLADGAVSVLFSPTLAKIVATLLVGLVLAVRGRGLFGEELA
jgi:branched-chain amino acid transport system permease protein